MKHMKEFSVPAMTRQAIDYITCDICGKRIETEPYEVDRVTISREKGDDYPEGGFITTTEADVCGGCFEDKVIPLMEKLGVKFRVHESERYGC